MEKERLLMLETSLREPTSNDYLRKNIPKKIVVYGFSVFDQRDVEEVCGKFFGNFFPEIPVTYLSSTEEIENNGHYSISVSRLLKTYSQLQDSRRGNDSYQDSCTLCRGEEVA